MKTIRWLVIAVLIGCLASKSSAQVIVLSGHVASATGIYENQFFADDSVVLSIDFTNALNAHHGQQADFEVYWTIAELKIAGETIQFTQFTTNSLGVSLIDSSSTHGINIGMGWGGIPGGAMGGAIFQHLTSSEDIGVSRDFFPAGIPFDRFSATAGSLQRYFVTPDLNFNYVGTINWEMTSYDGSLDLPDLPSPTTLSPVPEPSTYGVFASLGLVSLVAYRSRRERVLNYLRGVRRTGSDRFYD